MTAKSLFSRVFSWIFILHSIAVSDLHSDGNSNIILSYWFKR